MFLLSRLWWSGLLVLAAAYVCGVNSALIFAIAPKTQECFVIDLEQDEVVRGSFDVMVEYPTHVKVRITSRETGKVLISFDKTPKAVWEFKADHTEKSVDEYHLCFENPEPYPIQIGFGFNSGRTPHAELATDKQTKQMETFVDQLDHRLYELERQQSYAMRREEMYRKTAEATARKVIYWSFFKVCAAIVVVGAQILYLRNFFEKKTII